MTDKTDKVLLLDMGNVVFRIDIDGFFGWLEKRAIVPHANLRDKVLDMYKAYERGVQNTGEFLAQLRLDLQLGFTDDQFVASWNRIWREDLPGMARLMEDAAASMPMYCLSNSNEIHARDMIPTRPQLRLFRKIFLSHEIGMAKPDIGIYEHVCRELQADPGSVYFFDDMPENVEAARKSGLQAHVYENAAQIRRIVGLPG